MCLNSCIEEVSPIFAIAQIIEQEKLEMQNIKTEDAEVFRNVKRVENITVFDNCNSFSGKVSIAETINNSSL